MRNATLLLPTEAPELSSAPAFRINCSIKGRRAQMANELVAAGLKRTEILGEGIELLHQKMVTDELERRRLRTIVETDLPR